MLRKVNAVFIPPEDHREAKKFCTICGVYYQDMAGVYRCPQCGDTGSTTLKQDKILKADISEPLIAGKKEKEKKDYDLPDGGVWIEDSEIV